MKTGQMAAIVPAIRIASAGLPPAFGRLLIAYQKKTASSGTITSNMSTNARQLKLHQILSARSQVMSA